jgi:hypothetical protein
MVAVFRAHDVPREALAAVLLFQEAAHREAATAELAREVAASLARRGEMPLNPAEAASPQPSWRGARHFVRYLGEGLR